jgi:hypothetical protein
MSLRRDPEEHHQPAQTLLHGGHGDDRVYSDDEDHGPVDWQHGLSFDDGPTDATPLGGLANRRKLGLRPTLTTRGKASRVNREPHRRLYSSAAAAAPAAQPDGGGAPQGLESAAADGAPPAADWGDGLPDVWAAPRAAAPRTTAGAFVGRTVLPRRPAAAPAAQAVERSSDAADPQRSQAAPSHAAPLDRGASEGRAAPRQAASARQPAAAPPVALRPPAAPKAPPANAPVTNRTEDGLNVVFLKRRQQGTDAGGGEGGPAGPRSVNTGWGNNFVRIDMKASCRLQRLRQAAALSVLTERCPAHFNCIHLTFQAVRRPCRRAAAAPNS